MKLWVFMKLSWVQALCLDHMCIEGDAKGVVDEIISNKESLSVVGDYVHACKSILSHNSTFSIAFVRREVNYMSC